MDDIQKAELQIRIDMLKYACFAYSRNLISATEVKSAELELINFVDTLLI